MKNHLLLGGERRRMIRDLAIQGLESADIAKQVGISKGGVLYHLRMQAQGKTKDKSYWFVENRDKALQLISEGLNAPTIAKRLDSTMTEAQYHLVAAGIRTNGLPRNDIPEDEVRQMYWEKGWSIGKISEFYNCDTECLRKKMIHWGIERRSLKDSVPRGPGHRHYKDGNGAERSRNKDRKSPRRESWQVAAICLGYPLPKGWLVHHHDENPDNNDWQNLWLFHSWTEHSLYHTRKSHLLLRGIEVDANQLALESGGVPLPRPPYPIPSLNDIDQHYLWQTLVQRVLGQTVS